MEFKVLLSIQEAAERLGLSAVTCKRLIVSAELRSVKVGRRRLIPSAALDEFVKRREAEELMQRSPRH